MNAISLSNEDSDLLPLHQRIHFHHGAILLEWEFQEILREMANATDKQIGYNDRA